MAARETREIDWRSAEVRGGTLTVNVIGASSSCESAGQAMSRRSLPEAN